MLLSLSCPGRLRGLSFGRRPHSGSAPRHQIPSREGPPLPVTPSEDNVHTNAIKLAISSLALVATLCLAPNAEAGGFNLAANGGITQFLDGGPTGFGLEVFPGYAISDQLIIEGEVGFHRGSQHGVRTRILPFMVGAQFRFDAGSFRPFVGAHVGMNSVNVKVEGVELFGISLSASTTDLGLDVGGGFDYMLSETLGVGAAVWFDTIFGNGVFGDNYFDRSTTTILTG